MHVIFLSYLLNCGILYNIEETIMLVLEEVVMVAPLQLAVSQ